MQNITYRHLVQQEGIWRIIELDQWRVDSTTIPLRYTKFSELDVKIFSYIRNEYHIFRQGMNDCFSTPKSSFGVRSPYENISDQTVPYVRALLCMWWDFSYHNWIAHPGHIYLGRMCATRSCRNPTHHTFGRRKSKVKTFFEISDLPDSAPPDRDTEDWIDYTEGVTAEIREALEADITPEAIKQEMMARVQISWGKDRPLPAYALASYPSIEAFIDDAIRYVQRPPVVMPKSNLAQVADAVSAVEDIKKSLDRKEDKS